MMNELKAIIVDDEINARENLRYLLGEFCKEVTVLAEATNVDEAVDLIKKHSPTIVFLDIEMPQKNGFQLLDAFDKIEFQIVFITAYDSYAIKAFQVAAIDYLLKPIDVSLLKSAIEKAKKQIEQVQTNSRITILQENKKNIKRIAIPYKSDYVILDIDDVLCIEADRMYSNIYTKEGKKYIIAKKLSYYESLLCDDGDFFRIHRSWIVNLNKIELYSKKEKEITLETKFKLPVSKGHKENFETLFYS